MGYGPSPAPKRTWRDAILPEYGTYMQFRKLKQAEVAKARAAKDGGESLKTVARGEHAAFDQFTDLLEHGAEVAQGQRKWLVGVPVFGMFLSGGTVHDGIRMVPNWMAVISSTQPHAFEIRRRSLAASRTLSSRRASRGTTRRLPKWSRTTDTSCSWPSSRYASR